MNKTLLLAIPVAALSVAQVFAQTRTISGRVTDRATGEGLPGVTVLVKGSTAGVSTNSDGSFTLTAPTGASVLTFSSVGFIASERTIGNASQINIALAADTKSLSEVVVVGYGTQERSELTGAVTSVQAQEFKNTPIVSVDQALQGRAPGVQISQNSGTPGSGIAVRVRGSSSITAGNEPLYVVDGIPINTGSYTNIGTGGQTTNALSDINPNDIESIEVLKDAASAAIYGSRASNGVVIITTKRGKAGKTKVNLGYYTGIQKAWNQLTPLTGQQQTELFLEQLQNRYPINSAGQIPAFGVPFRSYADAAAYAFGGAGLSVVGGIYQAVDDGDGVRDVATFQNPSSAPNTNWQNEIFRTAPISNYELTLSGGNNGTRFLLSGNYFDQTGIVLGSDFKRGNVRLNLDHEVNTHIRVGTNLGLSRSASNRIQNDNNINGVVSTAILVASDIPKYRANGTYYKDPGASTENPLAAAKEPFLESISARLIGTTFAEFEYIKNLRFRTTVGLDYLTFRDNTFNPTTTNTGAGANGSAVASYRQDANFNWDNVVTYSKTFAEAHDITALVGVNYQQDRFSELFATASSFPGNDIRQLSAGALKTGASSSATGWNLFGVFSRLNYAYKGKYLLSGSIRRDGSSRFGQENRYGVFPAISGGWRISEESFMDGLSQISNLKLRASYGETGNSDIGNFSSLALIGTGANYLQLGGLAPTQLANPNLKWERTSQTDLGIDLGFFNNRVNFIADVYQKKTRDLLLARPLVFDTGFGSYTANIGNIENKGLELGLTTVNFNASEPGGFEWTSNFNISFNRNKVTKLSGPASAAGFASWLAEGQPLGAFRGYRVEGIFQTQEDINAVDANAKSKTGLTTSVYQSTLTRPGDIKFKDLNGDGVITSADQEILGNAQPKFYGGFTNTLSFKGFDVTAFLQYNYGNKIYNNTKSFSEGMNGVFGQTAGVLNRWTPTNTNTDVPRAVYGDPNNNRRVSDRFIEDGSYARLKNVVLGYTFSSALASRAHVSSLRIYAQAQNLVTFTNYSGLDPEVNTFSGSSISLGTDFLVYPQARTITFGVNLGL
ncbi:TonB-dependent receptor [Hymenobacter taeanensis]|uniref:TonB-dependent receptor n=1 Tax=Hymenobacter taeanensis TaxID=2735321 RepID=A0A6M6BCZ7_9BACT|nr:MULTISPECIES: TonB-dependent receptor [Hymenobacter]QJX45800.1 TonB-dependent receptor [Hymenobacter taeanensis]UOQ79643.1 TonB-dependent receptor [Hymenobacter sp. 5414T-23]